MRLIISLAQMKILSRLQTTNPQQIKNRADALTQELLREMYLASLMILRPCIKRSFLLPKRQVHYKPKAIFSRKPGFAHSVMGTLTFQVLLAP